MLDLSFDPGTGVNGGITAMVLQPNGKIVIAGAFTAYDGTNRAGIARVNSGGSLDPTFDAGVGANALITALEGLSAIKLAFQPDKLGSPFRKCSRKGHRHET